MFGQLGWAAGRTDPAEDALIAVEQQLYPHPLETLDNLRDELVFTAR
ncbi:MAG: hypothetical protein ACKOAN_07315 [Chakrabartia sp.]